jgi:hypothetical protein
VGSSRSPDGTSPGQAAGSWRSSAFGLPLEGDFAAPGLPIGAPAPARPPTRLALCSRAELDAGWPAAEAERLAVEHLGRARPQRTIDHHPDAGYRLYANHFGLARVSPDGLEVRCAPPGVAPWRWQRFLVGRVLPFTAAIRGLEPVHAGAVCLDGATVGLIGSSGAGKTSVVLRMVLAGAGFVSDDVLALEPDGPELLAHAGAAVAAVRPEEDRLLGRDRRRVGRLLGRSDKVYLEVEREHRPRPLRALYFLQRRADGRGIELEALAPDPALLLGSTFVIEVRTRARLVAQMDVASRLARDVPLFRAAAGADVDAAALAARLAEHVREVVS